MQKEKAKREPHWRPSLAKFLVGWVLIWWLALLVFFFFDFSSRYLSPDNAIEFALYKAVFFAFLSALQMLWVRRQLRVRLQYWIPLALLGALAGTIAFLLLDTYVLGPHLPASTSQLWGRPVPEVVRIIRLEYAADYVAHGTLLWSLPVMFQWAVLRKHSRRHALWLLAALAHNPLATVTIIQFLELPHVVQVHRELGISYGFLPDPPDAALLLDLAIPSLVTGLALYWILAPRQNTGPALGLHLFRLGRRDHDAAVVPPEVTMRP